MYNYRYINKYPSITQTLILLEFVYVLVWVSRGEGAEGVCGFGLVGGGGMGMGDASVNNINASHCQPTHFRVKTVALREA